MAGRKISSDALKLVGMLTLVVVFFAALVWLTRRDLLVTIIFSLALFAAIALITLFLIKRERLKVLAGGIDAVDKLSARHFAYFLKELFKRQGFTVGEIALVGNHGADLVLEKAGKKLVVQARRWQNKAGIRVVQELLDALQAHSAHRGIAISNNYFTDQAVELARSSGIELWDRDKLIKDGRG